jgi:NTE family protein
MPEKVIADKTHLIKQTSFFAELESYQIEFIAKKAEFFEYKRDEFVYKEGDASNAFYLIVSGRARAFTAKHGGEVTTLEYLHRGSYFGIISLLTNEPHSMSVQIVNDSIILTIRKEDFHAILRTLPQLAVHFSSILARRLKRKELGQKTVFESMIISVYGAQRGIGSTFYAISLARALHKETKKSVIFLDISDADDQGLSKFLDVKEPLPCLDLIPVFFDEVKIKNSIVRHESGINILRLPYGQRTSLDNAQIAALLSYLTTIFDYCILDLACGINDTALSILGQSDRIHFLTDNQKENVATLNNLIEALEKVLREPQKRIKVFVSELNGRLKDQYLLKYKVYATLTDIKESEKEYHLTIRRIAREIGEVLIGIALGSGAARGLSLIGVIKVLEKEGIPIDVVAGSSMGALIGAFWVAGNKGTDMEKIAVENKRMFGTFSFTDFKFPLRGLISDIKTIYFLKRYLGNKTFQDVRFPLKIVAASLEDRKEVIVDSGELADAVRASISIPGIYSPVKHSGRYLIDGGVLNPVPVSVLLKMNVKKIIAVNILPSPEDIEKGLLIEKEKSAKEDEEIKHKSFLDRIFFKVNRKAMKFLRPNILEIITNSIEALEYSMAESSCRRADVTIHPSVGGWSWRDFLNPEVLISLGEEACLRALPEIKNLIEED